MKKLIILLAFALTADASIRFGKSDGTLTNKVKHIQIGSHPVKKVEIYIGGTLRKVWEKVAGPTITSFTVAPQTIDLDTRATGTIAFNFGVTGTPSTPTASPSMITFVRLANGIFVYNRAGLTQFGATNGSSTIDNQNLQTISFFPPPNRIPVNYYFITFRNALVKQKTPIKINIGDNAYNLNYSDHLPNTDSIAWDRFRSVTIPSADRVSVGGDVALTAFGNRFISAINQIPQIRQISFYPSRSDDFSNTWIISLVTGRTGNLNTFTKIPQRIIVNGMSFNVVKTGSFQSNNIHGDTYRSVLVTNSAFRGGVGTWNINVQYSDGSYAVAPSLTKSINFELVDNEQVTLTSQGSGAFRFGNSRTGAFYFTSLQNQFGLGGRVNGWTYRYPTTGKTPSKLVLNGREFDLNRGTSSDRWNTPTIIDANFQASATKLSWGINVKFTDGTYLNNTRSHLFQTDAGITTAHISNTITGGQVGATYTASGGQNLSQSVPNIPQPNQTTLYRLIASNGNGLSHKEATVTVTKNPTLTNCRRTGFNNLGFLYQFGFTLTGLPRPTVTYAFSGGKTGTVSNSHYTQGSNPYTWTIDGWRVNFANDNNQSLTLTATNNSGSVTCRINNINI